MEFSNGIYNGIFSGNGIEFFFTLLKFHQFFIIFTYSGAFHFFPMHREGGGGGAPSLKQLTPLRDFFSP